MHQGTARTGGSSTTIKLELGDPPAGADTTDDAYNGYTVVIIDGVGKGQARRITDYTGGTTREATVSPAWATTPTDQSRYGILP